MNQSNQRTLGAILYEDFEPLDLYGPIEMFGLLAPELKIVTVAEEPGAVGSFAGVKTIAEFGFDECPSLNLILLPGGIGSSQQVENSALLGFLRDRTRSAEITMSVCVRDQRFWRRQGCLMAVMPPRTSSSSNTRPTKVTRCTGWRKRGGSRTDRMSRRRAFQRVPTWLSP